MSMFKDIKKWALGLTAGTMLIMTNVACPDNPIVPPQNNSPGQTFQVSPAFGTSPLNVKVVGNATDPDGASDIASYRTIMKNNANSDSLVFNKNPLDTTLTLTCPSGFENVVYNFKAEVKDRAGASDVKTASVIVGKKPNTAPTLAPLNVSPTSGRAPLNVRIKESATDPDSLSDIKDYGVVLQHANGNKDTLRQNPLDTTLVFYNPVSISAYVRDKSGFEDRRGPINVDVRRPSLTQSTTLENLVNIRYNAVFSELDSASLEVKKNSQQIISKTIKPTANQDYTEVFSWQTNSDITKGNYDFTARWRTPEGSDTSITTNREIRNYLPTLNVSGLQTSMDEEDTLDIDLQSRLAGADSNPEDNPVPLQNAVSLDKQTQVSVNENKNTVRVIALGDNSGQYGIQAEYGSNEGGINQGIIQGNIYDLPRIKGILESNETHLGIQGTIRVYQIAGTDTLVLLTKTSDAQGNNLTDANGNFNFKINRRSSELENILLMARQGMPENYQGWVRTIKLPTGDNSNLLIRAVPYGDYTGNAQEFVQFMLELAGSPGNRRFDFNGEYLRGLPGFGNFRGLQKIRILDHGYFADSLSRFTTPQQNNITSKILDPNDISGIIGFYNIDPSKIVFGNDTTFADYTITGNIGGGIPGWGIIPSQGIIVVTPKTDMTYSGYTQTYNTGRSLVSRGVIYINFINNTTISHEHGHMLIGSGHPISLPLNQSVMRASGNVISTTGPADKKAGKINYELTFMRAPPSPYDDTFYTLDGLINILRENFK